MTVQIRSSLFPSQLTHRDTHLYHVFCWDCFSCTLIVRLVFWPGSLFLSTYPRGPSFHFFFSFVLVVPLPSSSPRPFPSSVPYTLCQRDMNVWCDCMMYIHLWPSHAFLFVIFSTWHLFPLLSTCFICNKRKSLSNFVLCLLEFCTLLGLRLLLFCWEWKEDWHRFKFHLVFVLFK